MSIYDEMYENGFGDREDYLEYCEARRGSEEGLEEYTDQPDPIEEDPVADVHFRYVWSEDEDEKNKDWVDYSEVFKKMTPEERDALTEVMKKMREKTLRYKKAGGTYCLTKK